MNRINTKPLPRTQMAANRQKTCQMQKVGLSAHTGIRAGELSACPIKDKNTGLADWLTEDKSLPQCS